MGKGGTRDRRERLQVRHSGLSATSSQDFLVLVGRLLEHSKAQAAQSANGNWSSYAYAGLPMLLAALQALVVEYEFILNPQGTAAPPDINGDEFVRRYEISGQLLDDRNCLMELRNEIIHPAHAAPGTPGNWPAYLKRIKELGLLNTTGAPDHDYTLLGQVASHRLFAWAVGVVRSLYEKVIMSDPQRAPRFQGFLDTFDSAWFKE